MGLFSKSVHSLDTAPVDTRSKRAFSVETSLATKPLATKDGISDATLSRFKRAWGGQLDHGSNATQNNKTQI